MHEVKYERGQLYHHSWIEFYCYCSIDETVPAHILEAIRFLESILYFPFLGWRQSSSHRHWSKTIIILESESESNSESESRIGIKIEIGIDPVQSRIIGSATLFKGEKYGFLVSDNK